MYSDLSGWMAELPSQAQVKNYDHNPFKNKLPGAGGNNATT
ncbi:hypothetical protein [Pontibacter pamirensis]|nr:hypothetical protein [Pontibacter pamirensis]